MNRNTDKPYLQISIKTIGVISIFLFLAACTSTKVKQNHARYQKVSHGDLVCQSPQRYKDRVIGDGHCVSLIKRCTQAPLTSQWRPGNSVLGSTVQAGTVIATFKNGRYPNTTGHHAAIFIEQDESGIWVWDQWVGKPVHKRLIRQRPINESTPGNTAQFYRVVKLAKP